MTFSTKLWPTLRRNLGLLTPEFALTHNFFFESTRYEFLGFKIIDDELFAVVKQNFIVATEATDLKAVESLLEYNKFNRTRNHDYRNNQLGIIFEILHCPLLNGY